MKRARRGFLRRSVHPFRSHDLGKIAAKLAELPGRLLGTIVVSRAGILALNALPETPGEETEEMALINRSQILNRAASRCASICAAIVLSLAFTSQGRAMPQGAAGPLPAAAPSDHPKQAPAAPSNAPAAEPNLAGTWKLNVDQSDNPMEKMREAQQESGGQPGGGRRGGGGGFGGGSGGYGRNGGGQGGANGRRGGMQAMAQLVIEQTPTSVKVTESANGHVIALYQANPEQNNSLPSANSGSSESAPTPAQWQDNKLVTTMQMPNGGDTTRSFEISPDTKQLVVTTKIETRRLKEPVTVRQVYDPVTVSTGGD